MNWDKIKVYVLNTVISIILAGALSLIPFYYMTKNTLGQHSQQIQEVKEEVKGLSDTIRDNEQAPIVIQGEIKAVKKDIENIKENQQRQERTLVKIYDILLDWKAHNGN